MLHSHGSLLGRRELVTFDPGIVSALAQLDELDPFAGRDGILSRFLIVHPALLDIERGIALEPQLPLFAASLAAVQALVFLIAIELMLVQRSVGFVGGA